MFVSDATANFRRVVVLALVTLFVWSSASLADDPTFIYLVRHAEKTTEPADDPILTDKGKERAEDLAVRLGAIGQITAIYASQFKRTQLTVKPLSEALDLKIQILDARDVEGNAKHILDNHPGERVVIAGHSNTVPQLVSALGGEPDGPMTEDEYDNLYIVIVEADGSAQTLHFRYGD